MPMKEEKVTWLLRLLKEASAAAAAHSLSQISHLFQLLYEIVGEAVYLDEF